mgnify:CR=1 FL=1
MSADRQASSRDWKLPAILAGLTILILLLSLPVSLEYARSHGGLYLFSRDFLEDIPQRLSGPGRLCFVPQPLLAAGLGFCSRRADARAGRPPCLSASFSSTDVST